MSEQAEQNVVIRHGIECAKEAFRTGTCSHGWTPGEMYVGKRYSQQGGPANAEHVEREEHPPQ